MIYRCILHPKIKISAIIFLLLLSNLKAKSQVDSYQNAKNTIYLEIGGIAGYYSLNYERILFKKEKISFFSRIGWSSINVKDYMTKFNPDINVPIAINGLYGKNHKIEFGIGQLISSNTRVNDSNWQLERATNLHANFNVGYRFQKASKGFIYRINYSPLIEFYKYYSHWGGISIGHSF